MGDAAQSPVLVMGAGAIGCFLGGSLQRAGWPVVYVGRSRVLDELAEHGLRLSDLDGRDAHIPAAELRLATRIPPGLRPALTLLCVKNGGTLEAARSMQALLPGGSLVLSMQNGLGNAERAQEVAPDLRLLAGMAPFNVAALAPGHYHRGSTGALAAAHDEGLQPFAEAFAGQGLTLRLHADLHPLQWGKLLLNLNNPVNALSGRPLRAQLMERGYRRCLAALQDEALALLRAAGLAPAKVAAVPPARLPTLLRLPSPIFRLVAARMLRIDAKARSSMADDLALGRATEIDALCGEVVRLAARLGRSAPLNARMCELVRAWPARPQPYGPRELEEALGLWGGPP